MIRRRSVDWTLNALTYAVLALMLAPWVIPSFVVAILWQFLWISGTGIVTSVLVD